MKKMSCILIVTMAMFFLLTATAFSEPGVGPDEVARGGKMLKFFGGMEITDAQKESLTENFRLNKERMQLLMAEIKENQDIVRREIVKEGPASAEMETAVNKLKALGAKAVDYRMENLLSVKNILTPEQFEKYLDKADNFREKRWKHNRPNPAKPEDKE